MNKSVVSGIVAFVLLAGCSVIHAQTLAPGSPSAEYVYFDGRMIAREGISYVSGVIVPGGSSVTITLPQSDMMALLTFEGTENQVISLQATAVTISSSAVRILKPDGTELTSISVGTSGAFLDATTLPVAGTYTILVDPVGAAIGSMTLRLHSVTHLGGTISANGTALPVSIATPGQNASYTFSAAAGQVVSIRASSVTIVGVTLRLVAPDSSVVANINFGTAGGFIDATTLPSAGIYTVSVDPQTANIGNLTLNCYTVVDSTGAITFGTAQAMTLSTPGQNAVRTFTGTVGERVSLRMSAVTFLGVDVYIRKPDGSTLASQLNVGSTGAFLEPVALPASGVYSILVDPDAHYTGNITLTLYSVPADVTATITPNGVAVPMTLGTPGQNGVLTFSGTAGMRAAIRLSSVTVTFLKLSLKRANATYLLSPQTYNTSGGFVDPITLPAAETYTITVDPDNHYTGNATVTLYDVPADLTGLLTVGGAAAAVTLTPGQNATYTFSGAASQQVTVRITGNTASSVTVRLKRPDGATMTTGTNSAASFNLAQQTLPVAGTYSVEIDPAGANAGSLNCAVTTP